MQTYVFSSNLPSIRIPFSYSCLALVQKRPTTKGKHYCTTILLFTFYAACIESPPSETAPSRTMTQKFRQDETAFPPIMEAGFAAERCPSWRFALQKSPIRATIKHFLRGVSPKNPPKNGWKRRISASSTHQALLFGIEKRPLHASIAPVFSRKSPKPSTLLYN